MDFNKKVQKSAKESNSQSSNDSLDENFDTRAVSDESNQSQDQDQEIGFPFNSMNKTPNPFVGAENVKFYPKMNQNSQELNENLLAENVLSQSRHGSDANEECHCAEIIDQLRLTTASLMDNIRALQQEIRTFQHEIRSYFIYILLDLDSLREQINTNGFDDDEEHDGEEDNDEGDDDDRFHILSIYEADPLLRQIARRLFPKRN
jgi:hypothetical protein